MKSIPVKSIPVSAILDLTTGLRRAAEHMIAFFKPEDEIEYRDMKDLVDHIMAYHPERETRIWLNSQIDELKEDTPPAPVPAPPKSELPTSCPKCGGNYYPKYYPGSSIKHDLPNTNSVFCIEPEEHLHFFCRLCGYETIGDCLDAKEAQP